MEDEQHHVNLSLEIRKIIGNAFLDMSKTLKRSRRARKQQDATKRRRVSYFLSSPEVGQTITDIVTSLNENKFFTVLDTVCDAAQTTEPNKNRYYISADFKTVYNKDHKPIIFLGEGGLKCVRFLPNFLTGFATAILHAIGTHFPAKYIYQLLAVDRVDVTVSKAKVVFSFMKNLKCGMKLLVDEQDAEYKSPSVYDDYCNIVRKLWMCIPKNFNDKDLPSVPLLIWAALQRKCDFSSEEEADDFVTTHVSIVEAMDEVLDGFDVDEDLKNIVRFQFRNYVK